MSSGILDESNNVLFIRSDRLDKFPLVTKRIYEVSKSCGSGIKNACSPYPNGCFSYMVIYFDDLRGKAVGDLVTKYYSKIMGYLVAVVFDDMTEIYDVCVSSSSRGKGVGKSLLRSVIKNRPSPKLWLGIDIKNPMWDAVLKLYASHGFSNPKLSDTTPHNKVVDITFVGLTWEKSNSLEIKDTNKTIVASNIHRNYALKKKCKTTLTISRTLLLKIRDDYMDQNHEYAGIFRVVCYDKQSRGILGLQRSSIISGSETSFTVKIPPGEYYAQFHTHPDICYAKFGCYIGWPSGTDMAGCLTEYINRGTMLSMVVSREGLYIISLTPAFQSIAQLLRNKETCIRAVAVAIKNRFVYSNEFGEIVRFKKLDTLEEIKGQLEKYYKSVTTYSLSEMISEIKKVEDGTDYTNILEGCISGLNISADPIIFNVKFFDWGYIKNRPMVEFEVNAAEDFEYNRGCPLRPDSNKGFGPMEGAGGCEDLEDKMELDV